MRKPIKKIDLEVSIPKSQPNNTSKSSIELANELRDIINNSKVITMTSELDAVCKDMEGIDDKYDKEFEEFKIQLDKKYGRA